MGNKKKKILAVLLSGTLLGAQIPRMTVAEGAAGYTGGICEHHPVHTAECGYQEAAAEQPCRHEHTKECYEYETSCVHVHTEECYPLIAIEVPAGEQDTEGTAEDAGTAETQTEWVRGPEPTACTHVCSEDSGCVTKTLNCIHEDKVNADGSITYAVHDASCGYAPAVEGKECTFVCEICSAPEEKGIELISLSETETEALTVQTGIAAAGSADSEPSAKTTEVGDEGADEDETNSETEASTEKTPEAGTEGTAAGTDSETEMPTEKTPEAGTEGTSAGETDSETKESTEKTPEAGTEGTEAEETDSETETSTEKTTEARTEGTDEDETDSETETSTEETSDSDTETETDEAVPDEAVAAVQVMIDALPSVEEVEKMSPEEQKEIYDDAQDAADAYFDELTEEQQGQVDLKKLMDLMNFFNGQVSTMASAVAWALDNNGNGQLHDSLQGAFGDMGGGREYVNVILVDNAEVTSNISVNRGSITFIGGKYTVSGSGKIQIRSSATLVIESGTIQNNIEAYSGTIKVNGGNITNLTVSNNGTVQVNGGNIANLTVSRGTVTITGGIIGTITKTGGTVIYDPTVTVSVQSAAAGKITVTPLAYQETFGAASYSLDGENWQDSNVLDCKSNTSYTVYARYTNYSDKIGSIAVTSPSASYTVRIPSETLTAGDSTSKAEICVDTAENFDLGAGGQVQVKVKSGEAVSSDGNLTLTRQDASDTLTSAMYVDGNAFKDIMKPVMTFTMDNYNLETAKAAVSFAQPTGTQTVIPAGTYSGTVTFEVTYSEQEGGTE